MAPIAQHHSRSVTKLLLIGHSGSGKTEHHRAGGVKGTSFFEGSSCTTQADKAG